MQNTTDHTGLIQLRKVLGLDDGSDTRGGDEAVLHEEAPVDVAEPGLP